MQIHGVSNGTLLLVRLLRTCARLPTAIAPVWVVTASSIGAAPRPNNQSFSSRETNNHHQVAMSPGRASLNNNNIFIHHNNTKITTHNDCKYSQQVMTACFTINQEPRRQYTGTYISMWMVKYRLKLTA